MLEKLVRMLLEDLRAAHKASRNVTRREVMEAVIRRLEAALATAARKEAGDG